MAGERKTGVVGRGRGIGRKEAAVPPRAWQPPLSTGTTTQHHASRPSCTHQPVLFPHPCWILSSTRRQESAKRARAKAAGQPKPLARRSAEPDHRGQLAVLPCKSAQVPAAHRRHHALCPGGMGCGLFAGRRSLGAACLRAAAGGSPSVQASAAQQPNRVWGTQRPGSFQPGRGMGQAGLACEVPQLHCQQRHMHCSSSSVSGPRSPGTTWTLRSRGARTSWRRRRG